MDPFLYPNEELSFLPVFLKKTRSKSYSFSLDIPYSSCLLCKKAFSLASLFQRSQCSLCNLILCTDCIILDSITSNPTKEISKICKSCYEICLNNPKIKELNRNIQQLLLKIQQLKQETIEINIKRANALEKIRLLNLIFSKLKDD